jgi:hypothetical protein
VKALQTSARWAGAWLLPVTLVLVGASSAGADEGMWTFDNPPVKQLEAKYGFVPTREWLDHVRLASVRFNDGGSGSFVTPDGLVLTNHHVARGQLQKLSTPEKDYVRDGFLAATRADEVACPDLELNVLMSMEDVTGRVQGAVKPGMSDTQALEARKAEIARIEKESLAATGLRSDVVTLYQGGEYWLYRYKKYTDVRLVFAPEVQAAYFGGDPDNFTYPRYDLDMALFRVYENGKPVASPAYLKWNARGAAAGDLVFVSGNPGSTARLETLAMLEFQRDHSFPARLAMLNGAIDAARRYAAGGREQAREAANLIFGLSNSVKALTGEYEGLKDVQLMAGKAREEQEFRKLVAANPEWQKAYGGAWDEVAAAEKTLAGRFKPYTYRRLGFARLPNLALTIVRYVAETTKPDGERLREFHDAGLSSLRFRLLSPAPVYPGFETAMLAHSLQESLDELGPDDPFVKAALGGKTPSQVAKELIAGTTLADPAVRKRLLDGGEAAVAASTDPLIVWVRTLDPTLREMRTWYDDAVESVETAAGEKIGKARFAVYGTSTYPDATFTLRLTYGTVKGYPMNGTEAPPKTTFYGLFDRAYSFDLKPPFDLPARDAERRDRLDLATPLDFVSDCDIIGGNSGSPVIDRAGEIVGLVFDGNIESLVGRYVYDGTANRAVAVDTAAMTEALRKLYDAQFLVDELLGKPAGFDRSK